ncbi:MAG TPA: hypothetical protein ENH11_00335 [Candidatus Acetothermia bacterium]|nr:hypothetical protein [Candidatus Acetothermia bacterium]
MNKKYALAKGLLFGIIILLSSFAAFSGGVGLDLSVCTVDLSGPFGLAPQAASAALTALGVTGSNATQLLQQLNTSLADIEEAYPIEYFPLPLVGGTIEIGLPFIVIDKVVFSGGMINDSILRGFANMVGYSIPQPIISGMQVDLGSETANVTADLRLSAFKLTSEVVKHLDLLIAGIELGAGVDLIQGSIVPTITVTASAHQTEVNAALAAIHLDGLTWTTFAAHVSAQIELGPPFLRLIIQGTYLLPLSEESGWWGIKSGKVSGKIGLVIRF